MHADRDKRRFWPSEITSQGVKLTLNDLFHASTSMLRQELRSKASDAKRQRLDPKPRGRPAPAKPVAGSRPKGPGKGKGHERPNRGPRPSGSGRSGGNPNPPQAALKQ